MSYIGSGPDSEVSLAFTDYRSGDGSTVAFTMSGTPASANMIFVFVNTVAQDPNSYTWNGSSGITFSEAPPSGTNNVVIRWVQSVSARGAASLTEVNVFSAANRGAIYTLVDGATITPDFDLANNFEVTLGGNRTLANPSNLTAGQSGVIKIAQDGTGNRTLAYGSFWKFSGGTAPTLTTTASAVDVLAYYVESASRITAKLVADTK